MSAGCSYFSRFRLLAFFTAVFLLAETPAVHANPLLQGNGNTAPVHFTAQSLVHDDENRTVTAIGDVELAQEGQILRADAVVYDLGAERVTAIGNVSLLDEQGNLHFAEYVELSNHMREGAVERLLSLLADGARFTAAEGRRENNGLRTTMTDATYTVCKVCEMDPHPLWQIKASKIVHDAGKKTVRYKNARLELLGVPMIYSPLFSHPDPTLKRKSGFLRPQYGWTRALGAHLKGGYYYDLAPDKDMTLQVEPTSLAGILAEGEWRQRFRNGQLKINASTANSSRKEEDGRVEDDKQRGHIAGAGQFDINDRWRGGFDLARTTDKQYLRLYDISKQDVLTNQVYAERFSGRDYSRVSAYNFQDLRLGIRPAQPDILPMAEHRRTGEPGSLWGGRWQAGFGVLGLNRQNDRQSVQRGSVDAGWERRGISPQGLEALLRLDGRLDLYAVQNSAAALLDPTLDSNPKTARGMATASLITSYPLVRDFSAARAVVEPVAGVSLSPQASHTNDDVPDEDSSDINFDSNNLFQQSRYPGIDRLEDGARTNYGLRAGLYGDNGRYGKVFVGQSYRFAGDGTFPQGSGLEDRVSDVVGQLKLGLSDYLDADYRLRLDHETLAARHHEVIAGGGAGRLRLNSRYIYAAPVTGTGFTETRQQIQADGTFSLTKTWQLNAATLVDIGNQPGLRRATGGIGYADECFTFSLQGSRNVANEASGENETKIQLRIGFRNIGEFSGPQISLGGGPPKNK